MFVKIIVLFKYSSNPWIIKRFYNESLKLHRDNGPAIIRSIGQTEYYFHGIQIEQQDLNKDSNFLKLKYNIPT